MQDSGSCDLGSNPGGVTNNSSQIFVRDENPMGSNRDTKGGELSHHIKNVPSNYAKVKALPILYDQRLNLIHNLPVSKYTLVIGI